MKDSFDYQRHDPCWCYNATLILYINLIFPVILYTIYILYFLRPISIWYKEVAIMKYAMVGLPHTEYTKHYRCVLYPVAIPGRDNLFSRGAYLRCLAC